MINSNSEGIMPKQTFVSPSGQGVPASRDERGRNESSENHGGIFGACLRGIIPGEKPADGETRTPKSCPTRS